MPVTQTGPYLALNTIDGDFEELNHLGRGYELIYLPDPDSMKSFFEAHPAHFRVNEQETWEDTYQEDYEATENIYAGYFMIRHDISNLMILGGLRYEQTDLHYVAQDAWTDYEAGGKLEKAPTADDDAEKALQLLKDRAATVDLPAVASRLGGRMVNGRLTLKVMGKDFSVDAKGDLYSDIHVHPRVVIPILNYIIDGGGVPPSGKWVPLRELPHGQDWYRLFGQRCEKPMKKVADTYPELFEDLVHLFSGKRVKDHYQADIAVVLHPLPNVPLLICYWKPDEGLASDLNLFFDATAEENLNIDSIFALGTGLVMMFEKIALRHGVN